MIKNIQNKFPNAIVECDWLHERIGDEEIRIYDCTTYLHYTDDHPLKPYDVESGFVNYTDAHIPNAAFLDLQDDLSDKNSPFSFTLPKLSVLAENFKRHGIGDPYHTILYSGNGMQWATRVWWMLYILGYKNVSVLNGGLGEWQRLRFPTESKIKKFERADFQIAINPNVFVGKEEVLAAINDDSVRLLNALTEDLHVGHNPRYGRPGRIPNSLNIPFHDLIDARTGKLRSLEEAMDIFKGKGITPELKILNYCGGGIAATLNAFFLLQIGFKELQIYDNSMSEWAMDKNLPIELG